MDDIIWYCHKYTEKEFLLSTNPVKRYSGAICGPITRSPDVYHDGTYMWSNVVGGGVRSKTLEEAAKKWAATRGCHNGKLANKIIDVFPTRKVLA